MNDIVSSPKALDGEIINNNESRLLRSAAVREIFSEYLILYQFIGTNELVLEFEIVKIIADSYSDKDGHHDQPVFQTVNGDCTDLDQAVSFLRGSIKWDGCSDWDFPGSDVCMLHFCCKEEAKEIGKLMGKCYDIAARLIKKWDG